MRELTLFNIINRVDELPEVPQIAFRAIQLLNNPETDVSSLAEVISSDQALTAKVLRLCNSAYYGLPRKVTTVSEAVLIVGFSSIKSLVLMITTQSSMNKGLLGYKIGPGEFWRHSIGTAETARILAQQLKQAKPEECFIAGLIHDIGKMVLNQHALPEVYRATNLSQKEQQPIHLAEQRILGFDHADIGAALAERWNFPPILVESIRRHHSLEALYLDGSLMLLPSIVGISNLLARAVDGERPVDWAALASQAEVMASQLNMSFADLQQLAPAIRSRINDTSELIMQMD
ncbi:MAG: hydrolase [Candidatus Melainabacteria bacterium HGW-Melainabacteria-1]|nr:MAG: hydrolase [Candidatus Melainabacteria bacterium HGW-Melainabacteria-1]